MLLCENVGGLGACSLGNFFYNRWLSPQLSPFGQNAERNPASAELLLGWSFLDVSDIQCDFELCLSPALSRSSALQHVKLMMYM